MGRMDGTRSAPEIVTVSAVTTAVVRDTVAMNELPAFFDRTFGHLAETLGAQGVAFAGAAFACYHGQPTETVDLEVGFPTAQPVEAASDVIASSLPAGEVARVVHEGAYDHLGHSWGQLAEWIQAQGRVPGDTLWEIYVTEPTPDMNPDDLRTELNWLLG